VFPHTRMAVAAAALAVAVVSAFAEPAPQSSDRVTAGGSLAWFFSRDLDLLGNLRADLPFAVSGARSFFVSVEALTAIERAQSDFTFTVREVDDTFEAGCRWRRPSGNVLSVFAGRRGKELVDAPGAPFAAYLGAGLESPGFRASSSSTPFDWRLGASAVLSRRDVEAELLLRSEVRWLHRGRSFSVGADARLEAAMARPDARQGPARGAGIAADIEAGPRLDVTLAGDRRVAFFAHYLDARHPLGIRSSGILVGFDYAEGPLRESPPRPEPPDVAGRVAAGAGGGRSAGQLEIRVASPPFAGTVRAVLDVEANVLTGRDTDELYYLYHLGIERQRGGRLVGIYAYHRSNHQLAHFNDTITSMNVLEAGIETSQFDRSAGQEAGPRFGVVDFKARAGAVIQSTGSAARNWNVRGGVRWSLPRGVGCRAVPLVRVDAEEGQVSRRAFSAGIAFPSGTEVRAERRRDDQYFGRDKSAWLVVAGRSF